MIFIINNVTTETPVLLHSGGAIQIAAENLTTESLRLVVSQDDLSFLPVSGFADMAADGIFRVTLEASVKYKITGISMTAADISVSII